MPTVSGAKNTAAQESGVRARYELVPHGAERAVAAALTFGAEKHGATAWRHVPEARERYYAAARRHLDAWRDGVVADEESGLSHLAHAGACVAILIGLDG